MSMFFGISDYGSFVAAIVLFLAIPGPGNLALITSTSKGGISGGLGATLGVIAGDQVLMWLAVAGVATVLATYPAAFAAVQWLGAVYLAWLGWKMITAKPGDAPVLHIRAGQCVEAGVGHRADDCATRRGGLPLLRPHAVHSPSADVVFFTDRTTVRVLKDAVTPLPKVGEIFTEDNGSGQTHRIQFIQTFKLSYLCLCKSGAITG